MRMAKNALGVTTANCTGEACVTRYASRKDVRLSRHAAAGQPGG
jgi:hypothetical protein